MAGKKLTVKDLEDILGTPATTTIATTPVQNVYDQSIVDQTNIEWDQWKQGVSSEPYTTNTYVGVVELVQEGIHALPGRVNVLSKKTKPELLKVLTKSFRTLVKCTDDLDKAASAAIECIAASIVYTEIYKTGKLRTRPHLHKFKDIHYRNHTWSTGANTTGYLSIKYDDTE